MPREVPVRVIGPLDSGGKEQLSLEIDGAPIRMTFRISQLSRRLITDIPDVVYEGGARRAVQTARRKLEASLKKLGLADLDIIETILPYGYRIAPDRVTLLIDDPASKPKRPARTKRRR